MAIRCSKCGSRDITFQMDTVTYGQQGPEETFASTMQTESIELPQYTCNVCDHTWKGRKVPEEIKEALMLG